MEIVFNLGFLNYPDLVESSFVWVPVSFMLGLGSGLFICYKFSKRRPFPKNGDRNSIVSVMSDKSQVIAHKGAALDGPENTLGAIRKVRVIISSVELVDCFYMRNRSCSNLYVITRHYTILNRSLQQKSYVVMSNFSIKILRYFDFFMY